VAGEAVDPVERALFDLVVRDEARADVEQLDADAVLLQIVVLEAEPGRVERLEARRAVLLELVVPVGVVVGRVLRDAPGRVPLRLVVLDLVVLAAGDQDDPGRGVRGRRVVGDLVRVRSDEMNAVEVRDRIVVLDPVGGRRVSSSIPRSVCVTVR